MEYMEDRLDAVEEKLEYSFSNRLLLLQAITHRSYSSHQQWGFDYERLEFLGDALIQSHVTRWLYMTRDADQGLLTQLRSKLVSRETLGKAIRAMEIEPLVLVYKNLRNEKGLIEGSFLGDFLESLAAAIYLDGGPKALEKFLDRIFNEVVDFALPFDYKSRLQEFSLKYTNQLPIYDTIRVSDGYLAHVCLDGSPISSGEGSSKKKAEQMAAKVALDKLKAIYEV